jgi:hypothetical protein
MKKSLPSYTLLRLDNLKQQELDDLFSATQFHEGDVRLNYNGKLQIYIQGKWRGRDEMV